MNKKAPIISCILLEPSSSARRVELRDNEEALRKAVGGYFESYSTATFNLGVGRAYVYVDSDADEKGLPRNAHIPEFCGILIIGGIDELGNGRSLTDDECALLLGRFGT